jgi:hypothetical protein
MNTLDIIDYRTLKTVNIHLPIYHGEGKAHLKAKARLYDLIKVIGPKFIEKEYEYPNPLYSDYPWRFDIYTELWDGRRIAIEIDGKVGHSSKKAKDKRIAKKSYLELQGIELFAFPTAWVIGKRALPDQLYYDELHLPSEITH